MWLVLLDSFTGQCVITTIHILKLAFGPHDHTNTLSRITTRPGLKHQVGDAKQILIFKKE